MIRYLFVAVAGVMASTVPGAVQTIVHQSEALGREQTYRIFLPADASEERRYPVLYLLHGVEADHNAWLEKSEVAAMAEEYRLIIVFPNAGNYGWYVDSPIDEASQYESYIVRDLIADVDARFPTLPGRDTRGIAGLSMGGHGALTLAAKHPELFGAASSMSGALVLTNHAGKWQIPQRLGSHEEHPARWEANSAFHLAENFREANVRLMFDCGREDTKTGVIDDNRQMHERLVALGVPHIYRELDGTHSWTYWNDRLKQHLNFHQGVMVAATPDMERWFDLYYKRIDMYLKENAELAVNPAKEPTLALLGSSSAQGMPDDLFPGFRVFNRGISADRIGLTSRGITHRMEESIFDMKPDVVVMKIGRNDLSAHQSSGGNPPIEDIVAEYEKVAVEIRRRLPDSIYVITSSFPVRDNYVRFAHLIPPFNEELRQLAERHGAIFVDAFSELAGEDGLLKPEYSADGLHLSAAGKALWACMTLEAIEASQTLSR